MPPYASGKERNGITDPGAENQRVFPACNLPWRSFIMKPQKAEMAAEVDGGLPMSYRILPVNDGWSTDCD